MAKSNNCSARSEHESGRMRADWYRIPDSTWAAAGVPYVTPPELPTAVWINKPPEKEVPTQ